jgi:toxin ParE1/3/4
MRLQSTWYDEHAGADVAERYLAAFRRRIDALRQNPSLGKIRHFRDPRLADIRSLNFGGRFKTHLIFFRIRHDVLQVFRVMHGSRDLPRRLLDPPGAED